MELRRFFLSRLAGLPLLAMTAWDGAKGQLQGQSSKPLKDRLPIPPVIHQHNDKDDGEQLELNGDAKEDIGKYSIGWVIVKDVNRGSC